MADETLTPLPSTGKLPDVIDKNPTSDYAYAWAAAKGGKIAAYELTGPAGSKVATITGYWVGNAPVRNPYTGEAQPSSIPPQWRAIDSKDAFEIFNLRNNKTWVWKDGKVGGEKIWTDHPGRSGMENQPDWNWAPARPADKPNHL